MRFRANRLLVGVRPCNKGAALWLRRQKRKRKRKRKSSFSHWHQPSFDAHWLRNFGWNLGGWKHPAAFYFGRAGSTGAAVFCGQADARSARGQSMTHSVIPFLSITALRKVHSITFPAVPSSVVALSGAGRRRLWIDPRLPASTNLHGTGQPPAFRRLAKVTDLRFWA
jgi:hypothetical protein